MYNYVSFFPIHMYFNLFSVCFCHVAFLKLLDWEKQRERTFCLIPELSGNIFSFFPIQHDVC